MGIFLWGKKFALINKINFFDNLVSDLMIYIVGSDIINFN